MRKALTFAFAPILFAGFFAAQDAYFDGPPAYMPVRYESSLPTQGRFPGEIVGILVNGSTPVLYFWDDADSDWERVSQGQEEDATFDGAVTVTGAVTLNGSATLGSDEDDTITANGPLVLEVKREDFDIPFALYEPTAGADSTWDVADTNTNLILLPGSQIGALFVRYEQAFGGTFTPTTFMQGGSFLIDDATLVDLTDNDGIEFVLGGDPTEVYFFDEDSTESAYCEVSVTLTDISDLSADDLYFGAFIGAAIVDAFNANGADTYAMFIVSDNAGDLDIETELNGGGTLNDDTGITWADTETKVLRVTLSADSVSFSVDGTAVTQTNAVLNADNSDLFNCQFGFRSAGTASAGVAVNYLEVGRAQ